MNNYEPVVIVPNKINRLNLTTSPKSPSLDVINEDNINNIANVNNHNTQHIPITSSQQVHDINTNHVADDEQYKQNTSNNLNNQIPINIPFYKQKWFIIFNIIFCILILCVLCYFVYMKYNPIDNIGDVPKHINNNIDKSLPILPDLIPSCNINSNKSKSESSVEISNSLFKNNKEANIEIIEDNSLLNNNSIKHVTFADDVCDKNDINLQTSPSLQFSSITNQPSMDLPPLSQKTKLFNIQEEDDNEYIKDDVKIEIISDNVNDVNNVIDMNDMNDMNNVIDMNNMNDMNDMDNVNDMNNIIENVKTLNNDTTLIDDIISSSSDEEYYKESNILNDNIISDNEEETKDDITQLQPLKKNKIKSKKIFR